VSQGERPILTERHVQQFQANGYTTLEAALPASLIGDLRRAAETGVKLARERHGPQIQVVQPIASYPEMDSRPFRDYAELPELNEAVQNLLTPEHRYGDIEYFGLLIEPEERPWCCPWHRDLRDHVPKPVFESEYRGDWDPRVQEYRVWFAQINCALYYDSSTWFVPNSVYRQDNTKVEDDLIAYPQDSLQQHDAEAQIDAERRLLQYCRAMPGAVQLHLAPGDFCIYRPCGLHMGNYSPNVKRATLHDGAMSPEVRAWWRRVHEREEERIKESASNGSSS